MTNEMLFRSFKRACEKFYDELIEHHLISPQEADTILYDNILLWCFAKRDLDGIKDFANFMLTLYQPHDNFKQSILN